LKNNCPLKDNLRQGARHSLKCYNGIVFDIFYNKEGEDHDH